MLTPQSGVTVQDALGLITIYPRPDVPASFPLPITHHSQPPSIPPFLSRLQSASTTAFSIQEHLTIRNWQCKHITKINRITVYPFIYKRVNRYISFRWPIQIAYSSYLYGPLFICDCLPSLFLSFLLFYRYFVNPARKASLTDSVRFFPSSSAILRSALSISRSR